MYKNSICLLNTLLNTAVEVIDVIAQMIVNSMKANFANKEMKFRKEKISM